jgi:gliding motility-associated-like protein
LNYQWFRDGVALPDGTDQLYPDPAPGIYFVTISNAFGCSVQSDSITVNAEPVGNFISEGFSPNGDGLNEVFFVEGIFRFPNAELVIYNRNGDEVYRKDGYRNDWDGTNKNMRALPDGNYFYVLDLGNGDSPIKGVVLINR